MIEKSHVPFVRLLVSLEVTEKKTPFEMTEIKETSFRKFRVFEELSGISAMINEIPCLRKAPHGMTELSHGMTEHE
jgi:hypothetical protein